MYCCIVKRLVTTYYTQEARSLFKSLIAQTRDLQQLLTGAEITVGRTVLDYILGQHRSKTRYMGKYLLCGSV